MTTAPLFRVLSILLAVATATSALLAQDAPKPDAPPTNPVKIAIKGDPTESVVFLPTGVRETSVLMIRRTAPATVRSGKQFTTTIDVSHIGDPSVGPLGDVTLIYQPAPDFAIAADSPRADTTAGLLVWKLGSVSPGDSRSVFVNGSVAKVGPVTDQVTASFIAKAAPLTVNVVKPELELAVTAPENVLKGEDIPLKFAITNTGTGNATGVLIKTRLPDGLVDASAGKGTVLADVGTVTPGQTRQFAIVVKATKTGQFAYPVFASDDDDLTVRADTRTTVTAPEITIATDAPKRIFLGRDIPYTVTVTNSGNGEARDIILENVVPANAQVLGASEGATRGGDTIAWNLGLIRPGESKQVALRVRPDSAGQFVHQATVRGYLVSETTQQTSTQTSGISAVQLEVVDEQDPIEVGSNVTYLITLTNQGTAANTGITVNCLLEDTMEYVKSEGPTEATLDSSGRLTFAKLPALEPKTKATWRVTVKAIAGGDIRFKVSLNSDQLTRDIEETEATTFYE